MVENRQVCLLVDSEEPLMERFVRVASQKGLSAKTRRLPVGDFLWILLPPGANPDTMKDMPDQELVCGFFFFNYLIFVCLKIIILKLMHPAFFLFGNTRPVKIHSIVLSIALHLLFINESSRIISFIILCFLGL